MMARCTLEPHLPFFRILLYANSDEIDEPEIIFGARKLFAGKLLQEHKAHVRIVRKADTPEIHHGKIQLSHLRSGGRCAFEPYGRLRLILRNSHSCEIEISKLHLRVRKSLIGGLAIPICRLCWISGNATPHHVIPSELQFLFQMSIHVLDRCVSNVACESLRL